MRTHPTSWLCFEKGSKSQTAFGTSAQQLDGFPAKKKSHHISGLVHPVAELVSARLGMQTASNAWLLSIPCSRLWHASLARSQRDSMRQVLRPFGAIGAFINPSAVPGCTKPFNWLSRSLNHSGSWTSELSISTASRVKRTSRLTKLLGSQLACSQPFASNWPQGASLRWNCQPYPLVLWVLELWKSFKP